MADNKDSSKNLRLGMVNFINTAPIYIPWKEKGALAGWEIVEGNPAQLNKMLHEGKLDAGLVSSFAYGEGYPDYFLLPDFSISAAGPVGSVLLISKEPPESLNGKKVGLTKQSATSTRLLYIILEDFWNIRPEYIPNAEHEDLHNGKCDGYMAIGDEALRLRNKWSHLHVIDLAEIWLKETGLPFVFAVWAVRQDSFLRASNHFKQLHRHLSNCLEIGKNNLDKISSIVAPKIPMGQQECMTYLKGIEMNLNPDHQKGLKLFFSMLSKRGDLPQDVELNFIPITNEKS